MGIFSLLNHLVDFLVSPFHDLSPVSQLVLLGLGSTILLLVVFKKVSDQEKIKLHKDRIFGNFLEIAIYRDQFRRSLLCQGKVLKHNLLYLGAIAGPLLVMVIPMVLVCLQLEYRLGYQFLKPGETFIIEARLDAACADPAVMDDITIGTSDTISLETPALRVPATGQIFWQAKVNAAGAPNFITINLADSGGSVRKEVAVDTLTSRFSPEKRKMKSLTDIVASGEDPIPAASRLSAIRVSYPPAEYQFFTWSFSPIVYYFILTVLFGLLLKPFMKVNI